jgi:type VI secretion system secreted protein VgrG
MTIELYSPRDLVTYSVTNWESYSDQLQRWPEDSGNWWPDRESGDLLGTKFGVTPAVYHKATGLWPTIARLESITRDQAIAIFVEYFYDEPDLDEMPWVRPMGPILDMAINAGPRRAVKILQRALNQNLVMDPLKVDGWIGPKTARGVEHWSEWANTPDLLEEIEKQRIRFYRLVAANKPKNQKFLNGWERRARDFGPKGRWPKTLPPSFPFA